VRKVDLVVVRIGANSGMGGVWRSGCNLYVCGWEKDKNKKLGSIGVKLPNHDFEGYI
jgi:hypothetical protein